MVNERPAITHYWAYCDQKTGYWSLLTPALDSAGNSYTTSCGGHGLRVVTAAEADEIYRTGKLPPSTEEINNG